jgi:hypothetical protein
VGGRPAKLDAVAAERVAQWYEAVQELGTCKAAIERATLTWRSRRRALGFLKNLAKEHGVSPHTLLCYAKRRNKARR